MDEAILTHALACYPRESCGLVIDDIKYYPCTNIAADDAQFEIDPKDWVRASKLGQITAIVHSHPDGSTQPSMYDRVQMAHHGLPWIITNGVYIDTHQPTDYQAPLLGREYYHGLLDCYTLIQDYYLRELGITLGDYERQDRWWERKDADSLYLNNFEREGFVIVDSPRTHDVLLCRVGRTEHVNHAAIYLGDYTLKSEQTAPVMGNNMILHHPYNQPSQREIYGQMWIDKTALIVRYKSLMKKA